LGEKNNSYFLGLEKQRQVKKSISKLLDENNKVIKNNGKYLTQLRTTMENCIRGKKQMKFHQKHMFDTKLDKILNDKDGEATDTECSEAIGNIKLNKSPGLDG
jgi:hypothetical protein